MLKEGRRPAGYYLKARTPTAQLAMSEEEFVPLEMVNTIRQRVKEWRERGYSGVTPITRQLERIPEVIAYARNDHLDFTIPYEWQGVRHEYRPDYLIRWRGTDGREVKIILEVKGFETDQDHQKEVAARRWVRAVNHHGEFGRWAFAVCRDPNSLAKELVGVTRQAKLGGAEYASA